MPITASFGALSYSRSGEQNANWDYWFLQTNSNTNFNGATFDSTTTNFYIGGDDQITANPGFILRINENNDYPQLIYNFDTEFRVSGSSTNSAKIVDITYSTSAGNIILWGSGKSGNTVRPYNTRLSTSLVDAPFEPTAYRFSPVLGGNTFNQSTLCSLAPVSSVTDWMVYRDNTRLIYRAMNINGYNFTTGPLTYLNASSSTDYIPQTILTDTTGNAVVTLNLSDLSTNDTLIRRVNKTSVGSPYPYYPTIWQKTYSFGVIYQSVLDTSNNIYFVSTNNSNSVIAQYDISGNLNWQRQITGVVLKGITYTSSYLYVCGSITSNNNLFIAKYDLSGNIQWQNKLSGVVFDGKKIKATVNGVYIIGQSSSYGFSLKVPLDGTIPGDGIFTLNGTTYTYSSASQTEAAASNTSSDAGNPTEGLALSSGYGNARYTNNSNTFSSTTI